MGVHDFSAAIYSRDDKEGEQCLEVPSEAFKPVPDNNVLIVDDLMGPEPQKENYDNLNLYSLDKEVYDDYKQIFDEGMEGEEIPDPVGIDIEMYDDGPFDGVGTPNAVLEIFVFPENLNITNENFNQMVKDRKYTKRYFEPYSYSWDGWDFYKGDESDQRNWLNYNDSTDLEMTIVWQVKESEFRPKILDEYPNSQVWIRNFTEHGYNHYVKANSPSPKLSSIDIAYVAYLFGIDYRDKTRLEAFKLIKEKMNDEFGFETDTTPPKIIPQKKKLVKKTQGSSAQTQGLSPKTQGSSTQTQGSNPQTQGSSAQTKCLGTTRKGTQCSRIPKKGQSFCYQHQD